MGMYSVFLRDWFDYFPRDQIFVVKLEDYAAKRNETLDKIFQFLGIVTSGQREKVAGINRKPDQIKNKGYIDIGPMRNDTRQLLTEFYADFNADLAKLMGDDSWKY